VIFNVMAFSKQYTRSFRFRFFRFTNSVFQCLRADVSLSSISLPELYSDSYCVESCFELGMLRLLDEYVLVVNVFNDVYVAIL